MAALVFLLKSASMRNEAEFYFLKMICKAKARHDFFRVNGKLGMISQRLFMIMMR